jgi:pyrimidine deaminase RibD-like protein
VKIRDLDLDNTEYLDEVLADCVEKLLNKQKEDSKYWGLVAAAVVDKDGVVVFGVNHLTKSGTRKHAERVAIENYEDKFGPVPADSIIVTTLSPCSKDMAERWGESCTELLNKNNIKQVYIGFADEKQRDTDAYRSKHFKVTRTKNPKLKKLCQNISNIFLK